jgi:hypothetical protein
LGALDCTFKIEECSLMYAGDMKKRGLRSLSLDVVTVSRVSSIVVVGMLLAPLTARASCHFSQCLCDNEQNGAAGLHLGTVQSDGGIRVFQTFDSTVPVGSVTSMWRNHPAGTTVIARNQETFEISNEKVICENLRIPQQMWIPLLIDGGCDKFLEDNGYRDPPCNDTPGCSFGPSAYFLWPLLAIFLLAQRRAHEL